MCSPGHGSERACAERRVDGASVADHSESTHAAPQRESERAQALLTSSAMISACRVSCASIPLTTGRTASRTSAHRPRAFAARSWVAPGGTASLCVISASVRYVCCREGEWGDRRRVRDQIDTGKGGAGVRAVRCHCSLFTNWW